MLPAWRLESWRARLKQAPSTQPCIARRWIPVRAAAGGGKRSKAKRGEAGGRGDADASAAPLPPGAPPPPPTVAPPAPKKNAGPLVRSSYRRPRRSTEEVRAEREAREKANAEAAQGLTRYLDPEALAAAAAAAGGSGSMPGAAGLRVGGGPVAAQAPGRLIIVDGYNYLNASPRFSPLVKSGRLEAARNAFHAALATYTTHSRAAALAPTVVVVYDAMSEAAPRQGGGPAVVAADRAVREAMERVSARFPLHSVPSAHRLREMALQELGIVSRGSSGGREEATEVAPNVTAVFSRSCEADTWILDEIDSVAVRWRQGSSSFGSSSSSGNSRRPPSDVVVVSDDRRVQDGVLYAAMELIGEGPEGSSSSSSSGDRNGSSSGGGGSSSASSSGGGVGAGLSLAAWACSRFDGELSGGSAAAGPSSDARRAAGGGGAAAAAAAAAWARGGAAAGAYGAGAFTAGGVTSSVESDTEGDWPDGDYDESGSASDVDGLGGQSSASAKRARAAEAAAPLTPDAVNELLSVSGDALAAADASLEALLGFDLGLGGSSGSLLDPGGGGGGGSGG